jgi:hypothetical protein
MGVVVVAMGSSGHVCNNISRNGTTSTLHGSMDPRVSNFRLVTCDISTTDSFVDYTARNETDREGY